MRERIKATLYGEGAWNLLEYPTLCAQAEGQLVMLEWVIGERESIKVLGAQL
jgi:hypothetical protein